MKFVVVCAGGTCGKEYSADTESPLWTCPHCERVTENARYPFLTAKLMQAYVDKDTTDWRAMHDDLLATAHDIVKDRERVIAQKVQEIGRLEGELLTKAPGGSEKGKGKREGPARRKAKTKGGASRSGAGVEETSSFYRGGPAVEHDGRDGGDAPGN